MQPTYLPWVGYFDLLDQSDVFVFYDSVQFEKQSWQQRNRIKTAQGPQWLTVPVYQSLGQRIDEVRTSNATAWRRKHWMSLVTNYSRAPFWNEYSPRLRVVYEQPWESLAELNIRLITELSSALRIQSTFLRSSALPRFEGNKEEPLAALAAHLEAGIYLSPAGAKTYLTDSKAFARRRVAIEFHAYEHPVWPQQFGQFVPYLSVIDLLFQCGPGALGLLRSGRRPAGGVDLPPDSLPGSGPSLP
jgi:WbqC-like protein family